MKRIVVMLAIALVLAVALVGFFGCGPAAPKVVKVAILAPLSGPGADLRRVDPRWRPAGHRGVERQGRRPEARRSSPIVEDSQCTPDPAVNAANKVIDQDKVKYIIGEVCSKASIPVSEIANAKKVIQISPTSTNPSVTVDADGTDQAVHLPRLLHRPLPGHGGRQVRHRAT